ncbi:MAG: Roadblock/LC7 domain protein [Methanoregulaceae archaeon PtaB.Bin056]|jgi:hypothetical protein|nr:MAG: Roadblock/LC7 domain protein [Methanoregulaceae archaeon PtaB.Bin056]
MLKEKIKGYIERIKGIEGILDCALISRDGIMLGKSFEGEFNEPWLAAMCATLFASAESTSSILKLQPPDAVSIMIKETTIMVLGAGEKLLIVAVIRNTETPASGITDLEDLAREIGGSF